MQQLLPASSAQFSSLQLADSASWQFCSRCRRVIYQKANWRNSAALCCSVRPGCLGIYVYSGGQLQPHAAEKRQIKGRRLLKIK